MSFSNACHPKLLAVIRRHEEFFAGRRSYLAKVSLPLPCTGELEKPLVFDELDWERDFDEYVRINVGNGKVQARRRLELDLGDDTIPCYHPYFGISIHHSFYGGEVTFSHGTSYGAPVIARAADWPRLTADMGNPWIRKLARGMRYCREHGDGVLLASYRGGNGPLDMASGVLGNALLTEFFDDPASTHRLVESCTRGTLATFALQQENGSEVAGGRIVPMGNVWVPGGVLGHISLDAACLTGPAIFLLHAESADDARKQLEALDRTCPLER